VITAGIDIGSLSAKAVIMAGDKIVAWSIMGAGVDKVATGQQVIKNALSKAGLSIHNLDYCVSTGYGRAVVMYAKKQITEISCHAAGTNWIYPEVRTVLDMGGQDCKVIRCTAEGRVSNFILNDKCAAGTGRFFERLAATLDIALDSIGERSFDLVGNPAPIDRTCAVFAQIEVARMLRQGVPINDIIAGCCDAVVDRVLPLIRVVGLEEKFSISGGIAKNKGVVSRIEKILGLQAYIFDEPQIVGAIGAAILAQRECA
jgi:predicted CoA-substrate-specific enzyme activase